VNYYRANDIGGTSISYKTRKHERNKLIRTRQSFNFE